jgi:hypothetical protein
MRINRNKCNGKTTFFFVGLISYILIILQSYSCKTDNGNNLIDSTSHGKRDYKWSTDTLSYPGSYQIFMWAIIGFSSNDVYVAGHNDQLGEGTIYHYNGTEWQPLHLTKYQGGLIADGFDISGMKGFSSTDIWAVGSRTYQLSYQPPLIFTDSSLIIHYDGTAWTELPSHYEGLTSIDGVSSNDLWMGGKKGTTVHYDGAELTSFSIGAEFYITSIAQISHSDAYLIGHREYPDVPLKSYGDVLFHYSGETWARVDSVTPFDTTNTHKFGTAVWSDGNSVYALAPDVSRLMPGGNWTIILNAPVGHMFKSSNSDQWAVGDAIFHNDGTSWMEYPQFREVIDGWTGVYSDGNEVFVVGLSGNRTMILHGK